MANEDSKPESEPRLLITELTHTLLSDQRPPRPPPTTLKPPITNPPPPPTE